MKKLFLFLISISILTSCCSCRHEPMVQETQKLIIPPHLDAKPTLN